MNSSAKIYCYAALLCIAVAGFNRPVRAETPSFSLPVNCTLGESCWIVNYVDAEPAEGKARDFTCGPRTYDAHHGTDFGIADRVAMEIGTEILAAANGTVLRLRNNVPDYIPTDEERQKMLAENRGCGNGVYIDHGDGWQTIYCHMKEGSITVKQGEKVKQGAALGLIGNSGASEFPHLHFGVFFENSPVDPFTGITKSALCGSTPAPLWHDHLSLDYQPLSLYAAGFKGAAPNFEALKIDSKSPETLPVASPALAFWASIFGVAAGDKITLTITGPDGKKFASRETIQDKTRARQFYFIGRRSDEDGLAPGFYNGHVRLVRQTQDGTEIIREQTRAVNVR